jgi:hypothetical protein
MIGDTNSVQASTGTQDTPWYTSVLNNLTQAATAYLTLEQQRNFMEINTQRLREGLPALDVSQYAPGVQVGMASDTKRTLLLLAGGAGVLFLASKLLK